MINKLVVLGYTEEKEIAFMNYGMMTTLAYAKAVVLGPSLIKTSVEKILKKANSKKKSRLTEIMDQYETFDIYKLSNIILEKKWFHLLEGNFLYNDKELFTIKWEQWLICFEINLHNHESFLEGVAKLKEIIILSYAKKSKPIAEKNDYITAMI